jgi:hypothetical protein
MSRVVKTDHLGEVTTQDFVKKGTGVSGSTAADVVVGPFTPKPGKPIVLTLSGTWTGTVTVKRSVDGGTTKTALTAGGEAWGVYTGNVNEPVWEESESQATFYLDIDRTTGTVEYRISQ